jgi:small conductance mechanosensitive channel
LDVGQEVTQEIAAVERLKAYVVNQAPRLIGAALIVLVGVIVARLSRRWLGAVLKRTRVRDDQMLQGFFLRSLSFVILFVTAMMAVSQLGVSVTSFAAGLGVTTLIVGFGLKDILSNLASGLLLLIYRPFRTGHLIEVEGANGIVEELTIVNTQMTTADGVRVIMPNSKVWGAKITNYSMSQQRRIEFTIKVKSSGVEKAISVLSAALSADKRVLEIPAPTVRVTGAEGDLAALTIWLWTSLANFEQVSEDEYLKLLVAVRDADIPTA